VALWPLGILTMSDSHGKSLAVHVLYAMTSAVQIGHWWHCPSDLSVALEPQWSRHVKPSLHPLQCTPLLYTSTYGCVRTCWPWETQAACKHIWPTTKN